MPRETYFQSTGNPVQTHHLPIQPLSIEFARRSNNTDQDSHFTRTFVGNLLPDLAAAAGFVGNNGNWLVFPIGKRIHHLAIVQISTACFQA